MSYILTANSTFFQYWGKPAFLSIEPTNTCNLKCPECPTGNGTSITPKGFIDVLLAEKIADSLNVLMSVNIYFQGEPLLHKNIDKIIKVFSDRNIYTILSTNAHFLDDSTVAKLFSSGLNRIIVSVDGFDEESFIKYRQSGNFEKVVAGISTLTKAKRVQKRTFPIIEMQTLLFKSTEGHKEKIRKLAKELQVDKVVFKSAQFYTKEGISELMPSAQNSRYLRNAEGEYVIKSTFPNKCWRAWSGRVISWNGNILPCCFDKNWEHTFANITEQNSINYTTLEAVRFIRKVFQDRASIEMCKNCSEGIKH